MPENTLVCPFLSADPVYALGVEFGMLYARMQGTDEPIGDYFARANQDQILLLASRAGWRVVEMRPESRDWFWLLMEKCPAGATSPGGADD